LVHGQRRGVDDAVGPRAQLAQLAALALDAHQWAALAAERMRAARLAEAAHEHVVAGVEEEHLDAMAGGAQLVEGARIVAEELALADVHAERDAIDRLARARAQLQEARHEHDGQIVDAVEAEVLEDVDRGALARARQPADDDDLQACGHGHAAIEVRASHPPRG
jgi:hypothetical protein